jgi:aryl-alcohol dehydrogenase-like predicted oxidoreductase
VGASIIGATSIAQLRENIAGAQFTLEPAALARIAEIQLRYPNPAG